MTTEDTTPRWNKNPTTLQAFILVAAVCVACKFLESHGVFAYWIEATAQY